MNKKVKLIIIPSFILLSSCTIKENNIEKLDLSDPYVAYTSINNIYKHKTTSYLSRLEGKIETNIGNSIEFKAIKLKKNNEIYYLKSSYSSLFNSYSSRIYIDTINNINALSTKDSFDSTLFTSFNDESNFSSFSFLTNNEFTSTYGENINSISPFIVYEGHEELSFLEASVLSETSEEITFKYKLSNETTCSSSLSDNIKLSELTSLNALSNHETTLTKFINMESKNPLLITDSILTLKYNKSNGLDEININEIISVSNITFNASFKINYSRIENSSLNEDFSLLESSIKSLINEASTTQKYNLYSLFNEINEKYKLNKYYSVTSGNVIALGGIYSQTVRSFKLYNINDIFFETITTSMFVNNAELRYENKENNKYIIASGNNPDSSSTYGDVSSWNSYNNYSYNEYIVTLGHTMENLTSYIINNDSLESSFLDANSYSEKNEEVIKFSMSISEDLSLNKIDSIKEYKIEMNHMSNDMGIPEFSYLNMYVYLDKTNKTISKIIEESKYKEGSFECESKLTTTFNLFNDLNEVPNKIRTEYNNFLNNIGELI